MTNKEKERLLLYGQLVVDFANAHNAKDAFNALINNWKQAHKCSGAIDMVRDYYIDIINKYDAEKRKADAIRAQLVTIIESLVNGSHISNSYDLKPIGYYLQMFGAKDSPERRAYCFSGLTGGMDEKYILLRHEVALVAIINDRVLSGKGANGSHGEDTIAYCLVNFIQHYKCRLKHCIYCKLFFVAKDAKKKHCYTLDCEREYQKFKKAKQREAEPVKYV